MLQLTRERDKKFAALAQTTDLYPQSERAIHNPRLQRFKFPKGKRVRQIAVWVTAPCVCRRETHRQQRRERRDCEDTHADFKMEQVHTIWVNNIKYLDCFFSAWAGGPLGWRVACVQKWPAQSRTCLTQISQQTEVPWPVNRCDLYELMMLLLIDKKQLLPLFKKTKYNKPGEKWETRSV